MSWKGFIRTEIICSIITVIIALGLTYSNPSDWPSFLLSSFIYSHAIGFSISSLVNVSGPRIAKFPQWMRVGILGVLFLTGGFVGTEIGNWIHTTFLGVSVDRVGDFHLLFFNLLLAVIFGSVAVVYFTLQGAARGMAKKLREKEMNEERLERLKTKAELEALQAKVNPHFLFNTLNSIASLIAENPAAAESTVEKLSDLFRYTLQRSGGATVKLSEELDIVRSYLDIEKIRFGDRLQFSITCDKRLGEIEVPPLLVQTLVENGIKHGIRPKCRGEPS